MSRPLLSHAVADYLRKAAEEKSISQGKLSKLTGYSQPMISRWFAKKCSLSVDQAHHIAQALGVDFGIVVFFSLTDLSG